MTSKFHFSPFSQPVEICHVLDEDLNRRGINLELFKDGKCFLVQLRADGDVSDVGGVVVIQSVDILHHFGLVSLDGC